MLNMINKMRHESKFSNVYQLTAFNFLLAFHDRRTTEKKLHNMRYLIMNILAEYSNFQELIVEFADFQKDYI